MLRWNNTGSVGVGTTAPSSTLQVAGTLAVGVANNVVGNSNGGTQFGSYAATYFNMAPVSGSDYYQLPDASTCPGRVYYLRNSSTSNSAYIGVNSTSSTINDNAGTTGLTTYEMMASGTNKTLTAISDGTNWTFVRGGS